MVWGWRSGLSHLLSWGAARTHHKVQNAPWLSEAWMLEEASRTGNEELFFLMVLAQIKGCDASTVELLVPALERSALSWDPQKRVKQWAQENLLVTKGCISSVAKSRSRERKFQFLSNFVIKLILFLHLLFLPPTRSSLPRQRASSAHKCLLK